MQFTRSCLAFLSLYLALLCGNLHAQDMVKPGAGGEPIDLSIDPAKLSYDYLVDASLPADDPANKKFQTLQAAYAAAPAGTQAKPTVIGLKPNVYQINGSLARAPSLAITKNWITFLGLTNNRRSVVLADNRGLQEGASDDGYLLDVNATGFCLKNLTVLNYCNCDYEYPGDPSKNLKMRNPTITQAVALQTSGDKHIFENVALLSRLDTAFIRSTRSYFKNVYIEGTDDWMGGGTISYWQDSTLVYPTGRGVMSASNCIFNHCTFEATRGMEFYKAEYGGAARPDALLNCIFPIATPQNRTAWVRGVAIPRPNQYSLTYKNVDTAGKPLAIADDSVNPTPAFTYSRELSDAELLAYNPWNLLRGTDNWDPANARTKFEAAGNLVYRITIYTGNAGVGRGRAGPGGASAVGAIATLRTGGPGIPLSATLTPANTPDRTITWSTTSDLVTLSATTGPTVQITGKNTTEQPQYVPIKAQAANGFYVTAYAYVEPKYIDPPTLQAAAKISAPRDGKVSLDYTLNLGGGGQKEDKSVITWYTCDDAAGANPVKVAVSRGNQPLKTYTLLLADAGKFLRATLEPKHQISDPGPAITITSPAPLTSADIPSTTVTANFRNFVETATTPAPGRWTILGNWIILPGDNYTNGYGIRSAAGTGGGGGGAARGPAGATPGPASLFYFKDGPASDMTLDLIMTPDKTEGTVFAVPGNPDTAGHGDFYIKYDLATRSGYSLRYWRTTQSAAACTYQFYKITNGIGTPLNDKQIQSGVFRQNTLLALKATATTLSVSAKNTVDTQTLTMEAPYTPTPNAAAGVSSTGAATVYSQIRVSYP